MISISEEAKSKYIKDSTPKNLRIAYAKKDISEISNINMGLPATAFMYDQGTKSYALSVSSANPFVFALAKSWNETFEIVNTQLKHIYITFTFQDTSIDEDYLHDHPRWRFIYNDLDGVLRYSYYDIADARTYKVQGGAKVSVEYDLPYGISDFRSLSLDCYTSDIPTHSESCNVGKVRILYSRMNEYNADNYILLKNIPDYDFSDYDLHYITKAEIEEESFSITESLSSKDNLKYGLCEASVCEFTVVDYNGIEVGDLIYPEMWLDGVENSTIPLGVFVVHSINVQYEGVLEKKSITAYSKITNLENKSVDWNTVYMYGVNTETEDGSYTGRGFEFARQLYSSVFNALKFFNIDGIEKYQLETIRSVNITASMVSRNRWIYWENGGIDFNYIYFQEIDISNPDTSIRYIVNYKNAGVY